MLRIHVSTEWLTVRDGIMVPLFLHREIAEAWLFPSLIPLLHTMHTLVENKS